MPQVFGPQHYALLREPERLPAALLQWMRRLVTA
jgi:nitric oxide reductase NorD protein